jgi:hypothetical protein
VSTIERKISNGRLKRSIGEGAVFVYEHLRTLLEHHDSQVAVEMDYSDRILGHDRRVRHVFHFLQVPRCDENRQLL